MALQLPASNAMAIALAAPKITFFLSVIISQLASAGDEKLARKQSENLECRPPTNNDRCPKGWTFHSRPSRCYYFSGRVLDFEKSKTLCQSFGKGADLVVVSMKDKNIAQSLIGIITSFHDQLIWLNHKGSSNFDSKQSGRCAGYKPFADKWKYLDCKETHVTICQRPSNNGSCPVDWDQLESSWCLKNLREKLTWQEARGNCSMEHGSLPNPKMRQRLNNFLRIMEKFWIDVRKDKGKMWHWGTGRLTEPSELMLAKIPDGCAIFWFVSDHWFPVSYNCNDRAGALCVQHPRTGPFNTSINVQYHRPDKIILMGIDMKATCVAVGSHRGILKWTITKGSQNILIEDEFVKIQNEELASEDGICLHKTTSILTYPIPFVQHNVSLNCFSGERTASGYMEGCFKTTNALSECAIVSFSVLANAAHSPNLIVNYAGHPRPMKEKSIIILTCTVSIPRGAHGILTWVVSDNKNHSIPIDNEDKRVKNYIKDDKLQEIRSELELQLFYQLSGTSVACFAYNPVEIHPDNLQCNETNLFCAKTIQFILKTSTGHKRNKGYTVIVLTMFFVGLFIAIAWFIACIVLVNRRADETYTKITLAVLDPSKFSDDLPEDEVLHDDYLEGEYLQDHNLPENTDGFDMVWDMGNNRQSVKPKIDSILGTGVMLDRGKQQVEIEDDRCSIKSGGTEV